MKSLKILRVSCLALMVSALYALTRPDVLTEWKQVASAYAIASKELLFTSVHGALSFLVYVAAPWCWDNGDLLMLSLTFLLMVKTAATLQERTISQASPTEKLFFRIMLERPRDYWAEVSRRMSDAKHDLGREKAPPFLREQIAMELAVEQIGAAEGAGGAVNSAEHTTTYSSMLDRHVATTWLNCVKMTTYLASFMFLLLYCFFAMASTKGFEVAKALMLGAFFLIHIPLRPFRYAHNAVYAILLPRAIRYSQTFKRQSIFFA